MSKTNEFFNVTLDAAVDNGNSLVKFCYDNLENTLSFPNIVLPTEGVRKTILNQGNPIDLLDVEIVSPAISDTVGRHFYVGHIAARHKDAKSVVGLSASQLKSKRSETLVTTLTALAFSVATKYQADIAQGKSKIRGSVNLGIGLPINEIKDSAAFADLLTGGTHSVKFVTTPGLEDVSIELTISLPDGVSVDDVSGMIDIAAESDNSLMEKSFGVADIGGVDMDIAFFNPGLQLDDFTSTGVRIDLNDRIRKIRQEFNDQFGQEFITSDVKVIEMLINGKFEYRHAGRLVGSIHPIANKHLSELAKTVFTRVLDAWNQMPDAEDFLFIGGGALILSKFIRDINEKDEKEGGRPFVFDDEKRSQYRNLRGTFRSLQMALMDKGEAAATKGDE